MRVLHWSQLRHWITTLIVLTMLSSIMLACGSDDDSDDAAGTVGDPTETLGPVTGTPEGGGPTPPTDTFGTVTVTPVPVDGSPEASPDMASPGATLGTTPEATAEATTEATAASTPDRASPEASPDAMTPVDLATAWENLLEQESSVMEIQVEGLPAIADAVPLFEAELHMRVETVGDDRHLTITTVVSQAEFEFWIVDDEIFVDIGDGPTALEDAELGLDALGLSDDVLEQLLNAPDELVNILAASDADWDVTGEEDVNDFTTIVQEAEYQVTDVPETIYFDAESGDIDARMWVEADEHFLVQLNAVVTTEGAQAGSSTPTAEPPARIFIEVLSVNDLDEIEVPSS